MAPVPARPSVLRGRVFRSRDALSTGLLTRRQLRSQCWRRLLRGVYADAELPVTHGLYVAAARLLIPRQAAIAGRSAAWLYGADELAGPADPVEVLVASEHRFGPISGLHIRHEADIPAGHIVAVNGYPVTSPARSAWDIAASAGDLVEAVVLLDGLLRAGVLRPGHVESLQRPMRRRGCRRVPQAAALADARSESPQESRLRVRLVLAGLPPPSPQFVVRHLGRFVARVDLAYKEAKLAIEYDGLWHGERGQFGRDRRRLNALHAAGWQVIHVTAADMYNLEPIVAAIRAALTP